VLPAGGPTNFYIPKLKRFSAVQEIRRYGMQAWSWATEALATTEKGGDDG
jgi:hypothetical protein